MSTEQHVPLVEARENLGQLASLARYGGQATLITSYGQPYARIVPVSDGHMPPAHLWDAARDAIDGLDTSRLPADVRRIVIDLDNLLAVYDGKDPA